MMSIENYSKVKNLIKEADAIIVGAGAGLSTSAGINYGIYKFKENFPELYNKYGFTDFYSSSFYNFKTEEERWSYWTKHISYLCLDMGKTKVYQNLYKIIKDKNYFIITTNADNQFIKNSFDKDKIFEVQGSLTKLQCKYACHNKLYDDTSLIKQMKKADKDCKIPTDLIPYCPICKGKMEVNLRKDNYFVEDSWWNIQNKKYEDFIDKYKNKNLLLLELGVGYNTPGIIRFPFEELTYKYDNIKLIRVNLDYADIPLEIKDKSLSFNEDMGKFLENIL